MHIVSKTNLLNVLNVIMDSDLIHTILTIRNAFNAEIKTVLNASQNMKSAKHVTQDMPYSMGSAMIA